MAKRIVRSRGDEVKDVSSQSAPAEASDTGSTSMASEPSEEDIRLRAYHKYLSRGGNHGHHVEDWVEAEEELKRR